jgi:hypothetical protein
LVQDWNARRETAGRFFIGARLCAQRQPQQVTNGGGWSVTQPRSIFCF